METIAFPDEVRALEDAVPPIDAKVDDRELQMADMLIDSLTSRFEPEKYRDAYRDALVDMVETKIEGGTVRPVAAPADKAKGEVLDLMEVLRRSVAAAQGVPPEEAAVPEPEKKLSEKKVRPTRRTREKQAA
jgi:DNA end-binding protein Ku